MKMCTILAGMPGAGKSSLLGVLSAMDNALGVIIDAKELMHKHKGDRQKCIAEAEHRIQECLDQGISFTQETSLGSDAAMKTILAAHENGYFIRMFYVGIEDATESIARVSKRSYPLPAEEILKCFETRIEDILEILPYCNKVDFYDNDNGFVHVGDYVNDRLSHQSYSAMDGWTEDLYEAWFEQRIDWDALQS